MNGLIIVGAGGFGLEVVSYAEDIARSKTGAFAIRGFLDDTKKVDTRHAGYPVLGSTESSVDETSFYIIAVGNPEARKRLAVKLGAKGAKFTSLLHPRGYIAATASIDSGAIIAPFAFAGPNARIGRHCIVNIHASAGHESVIGDYSILSPYAGIHGQAVLGESVFVGSHACVTARMKIGDNAKIAEGAIVHNDTPAAIKR